MEEFLASRVSPPPSWLDKEFVQTALRSSGDDTLVVKTCDVRSDAAMGMFACDVYPVTATLADGEQRHLIVKCRAQAGLGSQLSELFDKEIKLLTETVPMMECLLESVSPEGFKPFGPKCYHHGNDPLPFVVLEDLSKNGYSFARRHLGLDFAYCVSAVRTLARFHAASMVYFQQNPEERGYFCEKEFAEKFRGTVEEYLCAGVACLAKEVKNWSSFESFSEKLDKVKESMIDRFANTLGQEDSLRCLVHADSMATHVMFKLSENAITENRIIDFQSVVYTSPVIDLIHYLYGCGNYRVHLFGFETLIEEYHSALQDTLHLLGCCELTPSYEDFKELLSKYDFYAFYVTVNVLPYTVFDPREDIQIEANASAAKPGIPDSIVYKGKLYQCLMMNYLMIFEGRGLFN